MNVVFDVVGHIIIDNIFDFLDIYKRRKGRGEENIRTGCQGKYEVVDILSLRVRGTRRWYLLEGFVGLVGTNI